MAETVKIEFRLRADVNGVVFRMDGQGVGNAREGTCTLHLQAFPRFPEGFDPISCPMICSHPTSSFFSRAVIAGTDFASIAQPSYEVQPARLGVIYNGKREEVLNLRVSGRVRLENGRLVSEHTMSGTSKLPPLDKNLTPFDDYVLPSGHGEATALVRFKLLALDGEELDGMTIVPYRWHSGRTLDAPLARRVEDIQVAWDGVREVSAYYRTAIRPLAYQSESEFALMLPPGLGDPAELLEVAQLSRS